MAGEASYFEDFPLTLVRRGFPEQTWFTFSLGLIRDESGGVGGVLCTVHATTARIVGERERERLLQVPHRRWKTMTFLAALRHDRVEAPWLLDGPFNGDSFRLYVEKVLVPTLAPGDVVILDNLGSHRGRAVRRAVRAAGARLFFLPNTPPT
jgi:hypothetical protein